MLEQTKEIVIKHINHKIAWGRNLDIRCDRAIDDATKKRLEHRSDKNDAYIFGAEAVLEDMGYWLEKDDDGIVTDIGSVMTTQYRVRYEAPTGEMGEEICNSSDEVQKIINRIKEINGCSFIGLDEREAEAYSDGLVGEWKKIFDF